MPVSRCAKDDLASPLLLLLSFVNSFWFVCRSVRLRADVSRIVTPYKRGTPVVREILALNIVDGSHYSLLGTIIMVVIVDVQVKNRCEFSTWLRC